MPRRIEGTTRRYYPCLTFKQLQLGYRVQSLCPVSKKKKNEETCKTGYRDFSRVGSNIESIIIVDTRSLLSKI